MDLVLPFQYGGLPGLHLYGGPRWSSFKANFKYIGGNEDFDVTTEQWGWGMGLEGRYPMGASTDFVLGGGFDWFFDSKLQGHDTSYAPDGEDVNPRNDYEFSDADEAIHQPGFDLRVVIGLQMRLGG
jgi:hypothetical protein